MRAGSIKLFRLFGITIYLHWTWFLVFLLGIGAGYYTTVFWGLLTIFALFTVVLMHEYGHALACRSVGGQADTIILWPLGGFAIVSPPWRPGAMLWSVAAGPLVNVFLIPITLGIWLFILNHLGVASGHTILQLLINPPLGELGDPPRFVYAICFLNFAILIFNLLPIYPLDGGKMLWSILWFFIGDAWALRIASAIGLAGSGTLAAYVAIQILADLQTSLQAQASWLHAVERAFNQNVYRIALCGFLIFEAFSAFQESGRQIALSKLPRHEHCGCAHCGRRALAGPLSVCANCSTHFDMFASHGQCPNCHASFMNTEIRCPECRAVSPVSHWFAAATVDPIEQPKS